MFYYLSRHSIKSIDVRAATQQTFPQYQSKNDPYVWYIIVNGFEQENYNVDELKKVINVEGLKRVSEEVNTIICTIVQFFLISRIVTCNTDISQMLSTVIMFTDDLEMNTPI